MSSLARKWDIIIRNTASSGSIRSAERNVLPNLKECMVKRFMVIDMKRFVCAAFALLLVFGLCACGETAAPAAPAAVETAEPTPEITPEPELKIELAHGITADKETKTLDLSAFTASELKDAAKSLAELPALEEVKLGGEAESVLPQLVKANPDVHFIYAFELNGIETDLDAEEIDLSGLAAEDFDSVLPLIACMKNVRSISLGDERNVTYTIEQLNALHEACPAAVIDYVVRI